MRVQKLENWKLTRRSIRVNGLVYVFLFALINKEISDLVPKLWRWLISASANLLMNYRGFEMTHCCKCSRLNCSIIVHFNSIHNKDDSPRKQQLRSYLTWQPRSRHRGRTRASERCGEPAASTRTRGPSLSPGQPRTRSGVSGSDL